MFWTHSDSACCHLFDMILMLHLHLLLIRIWAGANFEDVSFACYQLFSRIHSGALMA